MEGPIGVNTEYRGFRIVYQSPGCFAVIDGDCVLAFDLSSLDVAKHFIDLWMEPF